MPIFSSNDSATESANWISTIVNKLPYNFNVLSNLQNLNPKYETFHTLTKQREELLKKQSVFQVQPFEDYGTATVGGIVLNKDYQSYIYARLDLDKVNRIKEYRRMASSQELSDCIDEITDEAIVKDE